MNEINEVSINLTPEQVSQVVIQDIKESIYIKRQSIMYQLDNPDIDTDDLKQLEALFVTLNYYSIPSDFNTFYEEYTKETLDMLCSREIRKTLNSLLKENNIAL